MSSQDSFFPDPLDNYKPRPKFPFDDRPEDDSYEPEEDCPVCSESMVEHSNKQLVDCALKEVSREVRK